MTERVAIVGVGTTGFRATTPDLSYRELTYEAAVKAYRDAGVEPKEIDAFVSTAEDFFEGYSIADEYSPDQMGAVLRPIYTVPGDFLQSLGSAVMMINSGLCKTVAVQGLSKASNMQTLSEMVGFALDPSYGRCLREHPYFVSGLEMNRYLYETKTTREQCAAVVVKNKANALDNPLVNLGADLDEEFVLNAEMLSYPLSKLDTAPHADGAVVLVLTAESLVSSMSQKPVWIRGVGWITDTPNLENRCWGGATYTSLAADMAYKEAGIRSPRSEIDFAEINDEFSYKELQHLEALRLCSQGKAGRLTEDGVTQRDGDLPVNVSGGHLGGGNLFECNGGKTTLEVVLQLRGEAGKSQLKDVHVGLAHAWRGVPTTTGAVAVLSNE